MLLWLDSVKLEIAEFTSTTVPHVDVTWSNEGELRDCLTLLQRRSSCWPVTVQMVTTAGYDWIDKAITLISQVKLTRRAVAVWFLFKLRMRQGWVEESWPKGKVTLPTVSCGLAAFLASRVKWMTSRWRGNSMTRGVPASTFHTGVTVEMLGKSKIMLP